MPEAQRVSNLVMFNIISTHVSPTSQVIASLPSGYQTLSKTRRSFSVVAFALLTITRTTITIRSPLMGSRRVYKLKK